MHRIYETDDIVVFWDSDKCYHSKKCVTGSPRTFDINRRPWIDVSLAPTPEIWQTVSSCPSGALTCVYTHEITVALHEDENRAVAYLTSKDETATPEDTVTETANQTGDTPGRSVTGVQIGECDYRDTPDGRIIYHTEVDPAYGGKGIAKRLVYRVLEDAEKKKLNVIPTCSYAAKVMKG